MHIGILQTDEVREHLKPEFNDYPNMFIELLSKEEHRKPEFSTFVVQEQNFPLPSLCDAYIITGSRFSVYDDELWILPLVEFIKAALEADRKIIGICFGHQLMAHYFGGQAQQAHQGWGVGVHHSEILSTEDWMDEEHAQISLLSSHQDQVTKLPDNASLFAGSEFCPNAGFVIGNQVLALQGHPEFSKPYAKALMKLRKESLGPDVFKAGIESLHHPTHETVMARWILNFLEQ